jgi:hypothetical protein
MKEEELDDIEEIKQLLIESNALQRKQISLLKSIYMNTKR